MHRYFLNYYYLFNTVRYSIEVDLMALLLYLCLEFSLIWLIILLSLIAIELIILVIFYKFFFTRIIFYEDKFEIKIFKRVIFSIKYE